MTIIIIGYYGNNFGDLLMLQGLLNKYVPDGCSIIILSYDNLDINTIELTKNLNICIHQIKRTCLRKLLRLYQKADRIIWGGGSCFNDIDGTGAVKQMLLAKIVHPSISVEYYGVGIDLKHNKRNTLYLKIALKICSSFVVRDEQSYELVKSNIKSSLCDDPVFLVKRQIEELVPTQEFFSDLIVSYRCVDSYFGEKSPLFLQQFVTNLQSLIQQDEELKKIIVFDADTSVDCSDNQYIFQSIQQLKNVSVQYLIKQPPSNLCKYIKGSKIVITGRLHIAVLAHFYSKKFVLLNYSSKNKSFLKKVKQENSLVEYTSLYNPNCLKHKLGLVHS